MRFLRRETKKVRRENPKEKGKEKVDGAKAVTRQPRDSCHNCGGGGGGAAATRAGGKDKAETTAAAAAAGGREDGGRRRTSRTLFKLRISCGLYEPSVMTLDVRYMQLPIRPSSMPASKVTFSQLRQVSYAGWWKGGPYFFWAQKKHSARLVHTQDYPFHG
jgi:hypothetical protein